MSLHLITGYAGQEHITSADQGAYNMGTYGTGEFVLSGRGQEFKATVLSNNSISIADGEAMMQGRFIKMPIGTTESLSIDNGTQGNKRCDLIVIRYNKNSSTGVETTTLAVVKGTEGSSYVEPSVVSGTITDGDDIVNEMKLYAVRIDGISIDSVVKKFTTKVSMVDYMANYQLPVATASKLGGVKVGSSSGLTIDSNGNLSANRVPLKTTSNYLFYDANGYLANELYSQEVTFTNETSQTIQANGPRVFNVVASSDFSSFFRKILMAQCVAYPANYSFFPVVVAPTSNVNQISIRLMNYSSNSIVLPANSSFTIKLLGLLKES